MKNIKKIVSLLIVLMIVLSACSNNSNIDNNDPNEGENMIKTITIIENKKSDYKIVTPAKATATETFAAEELALFLKSLTGSTLTVVDDKKYIFNPNDKVISIGKTNILKTSGINTDAMYAKLNLTGFYIKAVGNTVIIDAYKEVGILYGVYELLEKYGGLRFVTEDYTYIPAIDKFEVNEGEQIEAPTFQMRTYLSSIFYTDKLFMARKRLGNEWGNADVDKYGGGNRQWMTDANKYTHNTLLLVNPDIYMEDHKEMYKIIKGEAREICMTYGITEDGHIDKSIPVNAATVILEELKKLIIANPEMVYFFVGQEDHYDLCDCKTCSERTEKYNGKRSSILVIFLNAILEELNPWVKENFGDRPVKIATFAYHYNEEAPVYYDSNTNSYTVVDPLCIPDENLFIRIAPIRANFLYSMNDSRQNPLYLSVFGGWQVCTENFWVWDYATNYSDFNFIFPSIASLQENYRYYREIGVTYCMTQANHRNVNDFQDRLKSYVATKLMWNADLDADELTNEFFTLYFGKYAESLQSFWELWSRHLCEIAEDPAINFYLAENSFYNALSPINYPIALLERSIEIIEKAIDENNADTSISIELRNKMHLRLIGVLVIPQRMVLRNITDYYGTSVTNEWARKYFDNIDLIGQAYLSETVTNSTAKTNLGL